MEDEKIQLVQGKTDSSILLGGTRTMDMEMEVETDKLELTIDEVVEGYVGSFGFSQMLHVFLVSLAWMFDSQNTLVTIFSDAQPSAWRCKGSPDSNFHKECLAAGTEVSSLCGLVPGTWEWVVGSHASSTIVEWSLICDRKFLAAMPPSLYFIGSLLGSAVYGRLADSWLGRKRTVLLSCILTSITAFITSLSPNIWIYALLRFANGFARSGIGICCLVLSTEVVGRKWRGQVGQYGFFFFTAGFLSLPLIAYPNRNCWRNIYRFISLLPLVYSLLILPFVSESPRWLLIRGKNKEALDVLRKFARLNGKKLPNNLSLSYPSAPKTSEGVGEAELLMAAETKRKTLWSTGWAAKRMILVMVAGFGIGFVYYGIQLNVENLNFNLYFTVALNAIMEIPAVFVGSVLLSFTNRRLLFSLSAYIAGVACILCIIFSRGGGHRSDGSNGSWPQLTIEGVGFMAASTAFDLLYIYCVELFPTNVRNFAVSMLRQALMLGASLSPLLVVVGRLSPSPSFLIFGVLSICSGLLSLWLPETRNAPLYETLKTWRFCVTLCVPNYLFGKALGAVVIAIARGNEKVQFLKSMGVDHVVNLSHENVTQSVKEFLKSRKLKGVDVLYDPVGGKLTKESLKLLNWGANILIIGFASGEVPVIPANIALVKNWTVHGLYWGSYRMHQPAVLEDSLKELLSWLARGMITIHISHTYSLSEANLAFAAIKDRKAIGKVMITFDDDKSVRSKL